MRQNARRLLLPAGMLHLVGVLEAVEILRQRRRGLQRSLVASGSDRDPASTRMLALTWWPAGILGLAAAAGLPGAGLPRRWRRGSVAAGVVVTAAGIGLRQWSIATLGEYFVGHVMVQPGQTMVAHGPYRWMRHPSYAGQWLEMAGVGLTTGNLLGAAIGAVLPLAGITARITAEERDLAEELPGYVEFCEGRARLLPGVWERGRSRPHLTPRARAAAGHPPGALPSRRRSTTRPGPGRAGG
jgi:protein-S-isoprenylcysteine O-methyltransferase